MVQDFVHPQYVGGRGDPRIYIIHLICGHNPTKAHPNLQEEKNTFAGICPSLYPWGGTYLQQVSMTLIIRNNSQKSVSQLFNRALFIPTDAKWSSSSIVWMLVYHQHKLVRQSIPLIEVAYNLVAVFFHNSENCR